MEGKNVYCTTELAHTSIAKDGARGHCAGKPSRIRYIPSVLSDLSVYWEHMCWCSERRVESIF